MDFRSSVGMPKTITSLWIGTTTKVRLAVVPLSIALLKSARAPFAVNIRREFEKCKPRRTPTEINQARHPAAPAGGRLLDGYDRAERGLNAVDGCLQRLIATPGICGDGQIDLVEPRFNDSGI